MARRNQLVGIERQTKLIMTRYQSIPAMIHQINCFHPWHIATVINTAIMVINEEFDDLMLLEFFAKACMYSNYCKEFERNIEFKRMCNLCIIQQKVNQYTWFNHRIPDKKWDYDECAIEIISMTSNVNQCKSRKRKNVDKNDSNTQNKRRRLNFN